MIKAVVTQTEIIEINITSEGFSIIDRANRSYTSENNHSKALYGVSALNGYVRLFKEVDLVDLQFADRLPIDLFPKNDIEKYSNFNSEHLCHGAILIKNENDTNEYLGYTICKIHNDYVKSKVFYGALFNNKNHVLTNQFKAFLSANNLTSNDFMQSNNYCRNGFIHEMVIAYVIRKHLANFNHDIDF